MISVRRIAFHNGLGSGNPVPAEPASIGGVVSLLAGDVYVVYVVYSTMLSRMLSGLRTIPYRELFTGWSARRPAACQPSASTFRVTGVLLPDGTVPCRSGLPRALPRAKPGT